MTSTAEISLPPPRPALGAIAPVHRLAMGLAAIPSDEPWIEVDSDLVSDLTEKRRLFSAAHPAVFVEQPDSREAQAEAEAHVVDCLSKHYPKIFERTEEREHTTRGIRIRPLGETVGSGDDTLAPLERAARCIQEDLCVMESRPEGWVLTAGAVCFPTRWELPPMLGRPMTAIHERVPGYEQQLDHSANRFLDRMKNGVIYRRSNWSLMDRPELFQPTGSLAFAPTVGINAANAGQRVSVRVETQTLQRLPETHAILFGIRIHRTPLAVAAHAPEHARALQSALKTMAPAMQRYKSIPRLKQATVAYLQEQLRLRP